MLAKGQARLICSGLMGECHVLGFWWHSSSVWYGQNPSSEARVIGLAAKAQVGIERIRQRAALGGLEPYQTDDECQFRAEKWQSGSRRLTLSDLRRTGRDGRRRATLRRIGRGGGTGTPGWAQGGAERACEGTSAGCG